MKKICAILIIFFICTIGKADPNKWSGFRGLMWGVSIKDLNDSNVILVNIEEFDDANNMILTEEEEKAGMTVYRRINDKLFIGRAELSELFYGCYKGRFCIVLAIAKKEINFQHLKNAVFAFYGKGYQPDKFIETWCWDSVFSNSVEDVGIMLEYDNFSKESRLGIIYKPILTERIADDNAKEAEKDCLIKNKKE